MVESTFQRNLKSELKNRFPGCRVLKLDPSYVQGIPDLLILYGEKWATLECKRSSLSPHQPNQDYYVEQMNEMAFSAFIYPENKEEVLDELEQYFMA
jgi:hypothetical protein